MAAKVVLGQRPKNFKKTVSFDMLDGTVGQIEVTYKYRTRTDYGLYVDELTEKGRLKYEAEQSKREAAINAAKESGDEAAIAAAQAEIERFSMGELMEKTAISNAEYIMGVADGWNLDADFTPANVQQLADELPGAAQAIIEAYRAAVQEGRTKN